MEVAFADPGLPLVNGRSKYDKSNSRYLPIVFFMVRKTAKPAFLHRAAHAPSRCPAIYVAGHDGIPGCPQPELSPVVGCIHRFVDARRGAPRHVAAVADRQAPKLADPPGTTSADLGRCEPFAAEPPSAYRSAPVVVAQVPWLPGPRRAINSYGGLQLAPVHAPSKPGMPLRIPARKSARRDGVRMQARNQTLPRDCGSGSPAGDGTRARVRRRPRS